MRPICVICRQREVAISDHKNGKTYYRKMCDPCRKRRKGKIPHQPLWARFGYRKRGKCELCGFIAKFVESQMAVFHVDGNLQNCTHSNLRTICLNCRAELYEKNNWWKDADIKPDF